MKLSNEFWNLVESHIEKRLSSLSTMSINELCALKEGGDLGSELIEGKKILFAAYAGSHDSMNVIIVVQAIIKGSLNTWSSLEKGIVMLKDGQKRQASKKEVVSVL